MQLCTQLSPILTLCLLPSAESRYFASVNKKSLVTRVYCFEQKPFNRQLFDQSSFNVCHSCHLHNCCTTHNTTQYEMPTQFTIQNTSSDTDVITILSSLLNCQRATDQLTMRNATIFVVNVAMYSELVTKSMMCHMLVMYSIGPSTHRFLHSAQMSAARTTQ
jgi:hypothetical protein